LWRAHVDEITRQFGLTVSWDVYRSANGYSWPALKRIENAPIFNADAYATFLHEAGHVAVYAQCRHNGKDDSCVRCELAAWRWAMSVARPIWTKDMHATMQFYLPSYRRSGTPAEQREIDALCSAMSYDRARAMRA